MLPAVRDGLLAAAGASAGGAAFPLYAWGTNTAGAVGNNTAINWATPQQVGALTTWSQISGGAFGGDFALAIKTDGTLWSWGRGGSGANDLGTLGLNVAGATAYSSPVQVGALTTWLVPSLVYKTVICTQR